MVLVLVIETLTDPAVLSSQGTVPASDCDGGKTLKKIMEILPIYDIFTFTCFIAVFLQGIGLFDMSSVAVQLFVSKLEMLL